MDILVLQLVLQRAAHFVNVFLVKSRFHTQALAGARFEARASNLSTSITFEM
jgi:hypothetical protein